MRHNVEGAEEPNGIPGTLTSVHLQCWTVNLQMREFSRLGTIHNHQHGGREFSLEQWLIGGRGKKKPHK